jgi:gluconate 2-dehydrogenase gamma chain
MQLPFGKMLGQNINKPGKLSDNQLDVMSSVQQILFPDDGNGPGADDIHALEYLIWVLSDPNKDPEEIEYIVNGIGWVEETAIEDNGKNYLKLTPTEREQLIGKISRESWGESWLSVVLSFIIEALLCDPQYGGNPDVIGWEWLSHNPGQPRPKEDLLYPDIITNIRKP